MPRKTNAKWFQRLRQSFHLALRWLIPGIGVKRWIAVILAGTTLIGLGFAVLVIDLYRNAPDTWWLPVLSFISLRFLDRPLRALIFGGLGLLLIALGVLGLNRSLLKPFISSSRPIIETVSEYRRKERGPRIVALGGGTGLSSLLRGVKLETHNLTAIVTVADDGGSSGELRQRIGILPPGDIRNCLAALSNDEELLTQLFQYRFAQSAGLGGHSLGNLLITALTDITGSFEEAVSETRRVLAVQGQVLPATLHDVRLVADVELPQTGQQVRVKGESKITEARGRVKRIWLEPNNPLAFPPTLQAILNADLIVVGPGSLFTSILPNLLVPDIAEAIKASRAIKFFVCNVATQQGETSGFTCGDHLDTLVKHLGSNPFDVMICNNSFVKKLAPGVEWVKPEPDLDKRVSVYFADLVDDENPWRHDDTKLARAVMDLFYERTGPLGGREDLPPA